jgi:hypothetical protein
MDDGAYIIREESDFSLQLRWMLMALLSQFLGVVIQEEMS